MKIQLDIDMGYRDALDYLLRQIEIKYQISRADARKLLASSLIRTPVIDEIMATCDCLLGIDENSV